MTIKSMSYSGLTWVSRNRTNTVNRFLPEFMPYLIRYRNDTFPIFSLFNKEGWGDFSLSVGNEYFRSKIILPNEYFRSKIFLSNKHYHSTKNNSKNLKRKTKKLCFSFFSITIISTNANRHTCFPTFSHFSDPLE